jgi:hypothetical protein
MKAAQWGRLFLQEGKVIVDLRGKILMKIYKLNGRKLHENIENSKGATS